MENQVAPQLETMNLAQVRASRPHVALVPFGATEPHNLHLPYGTDTFQVINIAQRLADEAQTKGAKIVVLPAIPYGTETNLAGFPLAINLQPSTLTTIIRDLAVSLAASGIRKIVLLNGHGGNDFKPVLRELYGQLDAHLFLINWYQVIADVYCEIFDEADDHAGEMETSLALACFPEWIARAADGQLAADDGRKQPCQFEAVNRGWVQLSRPWHLLTTNSGAGNPHRATAEKGHKLLDLLVQRLAPFLVELSASRIDHQFPYQATHSPGASTPGD